MQRTAWSLGCRSTVFVEPSGLDAQNQATVRDVVMLFQAALRDPVLRTYLGTSQFVLHTPRGARSIAHSSRTLRYRREVTAAKTGYLDIAGYCLVQYVSDPAGDFITVVLGAPTKSSRSRESIRLCDFVRKNRARRS
jgi:D-alanyl-D-alanine carboxypeptidase